jgi:hypothetical protein
MAEGALNEITPWRRRSLTFPPDSWRAWVHLAVWEAWMGCCYSASSPSAFRSSSSPDRIMTFEDLSRCYPAAGRCRAKDHSTGALNAGVQRWADYVAARRRGCWELWSAAAPKPITDDFLKLLHHSFAHNWRDPRTWPWSRMLWAYGFTFAGVMLAASFTLLIWTADSFKRPVKAPVFKIETSQEFRLTPK